MEETRPITQHVFSILPPATIALIRHETLSRKLESFCSSNTNREPIKLRQPSDPWVGDRQRNLNLKPANPQMTSKRFKEESDSNTQEISNKGLYSLQVRFQSLSNLSMG